MVARDTMEDIYKNMVQKKQTNTALLLLVTGLIVILLVLFGVKLFHSNGPSFQLKGSSEPITKASNFTVDIYLDSLKGQEVTAYDIQLDYDKTKAKLISADSGGYLTNPLVIKWDVDSAWFAASANPAFTALDAPGSSVITIKDASEVYVAQKGGLNPSKAQYRFSIKNQ
jgi:hypothetical protein